MIFCIRRLRDRIQLLKSDRGDEGDGGDGGRKSPNMCVSSNKYDHNAHVTVVKKIECFVVVTNG